MPLCRLGPPDESTLSASRVPVALLERLPGGAERRGYDPRVSGQPASPRPSRRAALGLGVLLVVSGCATTAARPVVRPLSPDVRRAERAARRVAQVHAVAEQTMAKHPGVASRVRPLADLNAAHLATLRQALPPRVRRIDATGRASIPGNAAGALHGLFAEERGLRRSLAADAAGAQEGRTARLFAAMAAGLGQQLAVAGR